MLANIQAPILIEMAPHLAARLAPGGALVLSGILSGQDEGVREAFEAVGLRHLRTTSENEWRGVIVARSLDAEQWVGRGARGVEIVDTVLTQAEGQVQARGVDGQGRSGEDQSGRRALATRVRAGVVVSRVAPRVGAVAWPAGRALVFAGEPGRAWPSLRASVRVSDLGAGRAAFWAGRVADR